MPPDQVEQAEQEMVDEEWEQRQRWFNVTHHEGYDKTIHQVAYERLDILMDGMCDPELFKSMEGYKGLDNVNMMTDRARGEIYVWKQVLSWRDNAAAIWRTLQEQRAEEETPEEDEDPSSKEQWYDRRQ